MRRREAINLFREIAKRTSQSVNFSCVSLTQDCTALETSKSFMLQISADLDFETLICLKTIARRHHLLFEENNGYVSIRTPKKRALPIFA
jgi:hypothetical protein